MPGLIALIPFLSANMKLRRTYLGKQILPAEVKPLSCSGWGGFTSQHIILGVLKLPQLLPALVGWGKAQQVNAGWHPAWLM